MSTIDTAIYWECYWYGYDAFEETCASATEVINPYKLKDNPEESKAWRKGWDQAEEDYFNGEGV